MDPIAAPAADAADAVHPGFDPERSVDDLDGKRLRAIPGSGPDHGLVVAIQPSPLVRAPPRYRRDRVDLGCRTMDRPLFDAGSIADCDDDSDDHRRVRDRIDSPGSAAIVPAHGIGADLGFSRCRRFSLGQNGWGLG